MRALSPAEFDRLVEQSLDIIPPRFRPQLRNLVFIVEPEPREPGLLGQYEGRPLTERSTTDPCPAPDRITLYQGPHQRAAHTLSALRRLVEETLWHEVAHYFGLDEPQVQRAEARRRARRHRLREL